MLICCSLTYGRGGLGDKSTCLISRISPDGSLQYSRGLFPGTDLACAWIGDWDDLKKSRLRAVVETGARQTRSAAAVDKNFMIARICQTARDRITMRWEIESKLYEYHYDW